MKDLEDDDQFNEIDDIIEDDEVQELIIGENILADDLDDIEEIDYDPDETERRRSAYSELKKADKIFNNSYNMGTTLTEDREDYHSRGEIKLDPSSPDYQMYDRDKHSDYVDNSIIQLDIHAFVSESIEIQQILGTEPEKKKYTKIDINALFDIIKDGVSTGKKYSAFVNSIHILDSISSLTGLEYKKLFDMLTYENKEILLVELDKNYHFLDNSSKDFRIYE